MSTIFKCKTTDGLVIKSMVDVLRNTIKVACFEVTSSGISLRDKDSNSHILLDIWLDASKFNIFELERAMRISVNADHLFKMLKIMKKKDSLILFIEADSPTKLILEICPYDNMKRTKTVIQIQNTQTLQIPVIEGYDSPIIINPKEYQKTWFAKLLSFQA